MIFYRLIIIFTQGQLFSLRFFRIIRWWAYSKYFKTGNLFYIAENVKIVTAHSNCDAVFHVGREVHIGESVYIDYSGGVSIGNSVAISEGAKIFTHNHDVHGKYKDWSKNARKFSNLVINDYAWIGANSLILESVKSIAEGSIIAAGAVLTKDTEPYGIYAGNPARKIGERVVDGNKV